MPIVQEAAWEATRVCDSDGMGDAGFGGFGGSSSCGGEGGEDRMGLMKMSPVNFAKREDCCPVLAYLDQLGEVTCFAARRSAKARLSREVLPNMGSG